MYSTCTAYGEKKSDFGSTLNKNHTEAPLNAHVATGHPCLSQPNVKNERTEPAKAGRARIQYISSAPPPSHDPMSVDPKRYTTHNMYTEKSVFSHLTE